MHSYNEGIVRYQKSTEMSRYLCVSKSGETKGHLEQTEDALTGAGGVSSKDFVSSACRSL